MGKKPDFLTPKAISNRIKARGLQKLRWYCQLCQKQCRDENGFKCHQTSASHRRQMELFGQSPGQIVAQYSYQFERDFMAHMRVCHPTAQVSANKVYNEFIKDKDHIHMNSTRWLSLSGFVQYLAKKGLVKLEKSPKGGWLMQMVPKDDETDLKRNKRRERDASEKLDEERQMKELQEQIKKAGVDMSSIPEGEASQLNREDTEMPIAFSVQMETKALPTEERTIKKPKLDLFGEDGPAKPLPREKGNEKRKGMTKLEQIHSTFKDKKRERTRPWIRPGIIVKILSPQLKAHGYYKQKGVIKRCVESYIAEIELLSSKAIVQVDQAELETVLPAIGGKLLVLKGQHEDCTAELIDINIEKFSVQATLLDGRGKGRKEWYLYEDVSKLFNQQHG